MADKGLSNSTDRTDEEAVSIWQPLSPTTCNIPGSEARPAARCGHVAVSCENGQRLLVVGGYNAGGILSFDGVWEFAFDTLAWSRLHLVDGPIPSERTYFRGCAGPPMGTDGREEKEPFVYINGGLNAEGDLSNDVWCLDVEKRTWIEVHRGGSNVDGIGAIPPSRFNHAMCRMGDSLAVHGGESSSGSLLGDLSLFHPRTALWSQARVSLAGPRPCPRSSHCLAYVERSVECPSTPASLVLFGGIGKDLDGLENQETTLLNDLWVLSPVTDRWLKSAHRIHECDEDSSTPIWSLLVLEGVGPSPRSLASISPRPCGRDLFLFGGYGLVELPGDPSASEGDAGSEDGDIIVAYIDDLWMLNLGGETTPNLEWVDEEGMGFAGETIIEGRNGHTLTWCGVNKLVLFGGFVGDGFDASLHVAEPLLKHYIS